MTAPKSPSRPLAHEPIRACEGYGEWACLACTDAADACVPWPCPFATDAQEGR